MHRIVGMVTEAVVLEYFYSDSICGLLIYCSGFTRVIFRAYCFETFYVHSRVLPSCLKPVHARAQSVISLLL